TGIHVVVEAILNCRSDAELDAGIEQLQCFGHEVCGGVPIGMLPFFIVPLQQIDSGILFNGASQVPCLSIDACCQNLLCKALTDALCDLETSYSLFIFPDRSVGKCYSNHVIQYLMSQFYLLDCKCSDFVIYERTI